MRLFVGLKLNEAQRQALVQIQQAYHLQLAQLPLHWSQQDNFHITLRFIGEVTEQQSKLLIQHLPNGLLNQNLHFDFKKIDWFPSLRKPIVLAAHYQHSNTIDRLLHAINTALESSATTFKKETKGFRAHVTLARNNKRAQIRALKQIEHPTMPSLSFSHYHLFESCYRDGQLRYVSLADYHI